MICYNNVKCYADMINTGAANDIPKYKVWRTMLFGHDPSSICFEAIFHESKLSLLKLS